MTFKKLITWETIIVSQILISLFLVSCLNSGNGDDQTPFFNQIRNSTSEIKTLELSENQDDLNSLNRIVGDARLVCLGESRHDIREQFQLKHRFIKYLVEEFDFSVFILEASMPYAELINNYIRRGEGDLDELLARMPGWFLWDTREISEILRWMRTYNMDPENANKLQFHGIDIVAPSYALNSVLSFLKKVDVRNYEDFSKLDYKQDQIDDTWWMTTYERFSQLSESEKIDLKANYQRMYDHVLRNESLFISKSSSNEYAWILRQAFCALKACEMFTAGSRLEMGLIRDSAMAENSQWIINSTDGKAIIWAHNVHVTRGEFTMTGYEESIKGMGYILGQELQNDMITIGASFNRGDFGDWGQTFSPAEKGTIDGVIATTGFRYGLFDLKAKSGSAEVEKWLNSPQVMIGQGFNMTCVPSEAWDAIFFIDSVGRTVPNPASMTKFRNMN